MEYFEDYNFHIPWQSGSSGSYAKVSEYIINNYRHIHKIPYDGF